MKYSTTLLILFIGLCSFAQEKDYPDFEEIFKKAKKDSTELAIYSKPPRGSKSSNNNYNFNTLSKTIGFVHEVKMDGVMLLKAFKKKAKKGVMIEYKKELHYIRFDQILKVKFIISEE